MDDGQERIAGFFLAIRERIVNPFLMDKEKLKYVLKEAEDLPLPLIHPRAVELPLNSAKAIVLVGIRRSGKTFLLLDPG